jgi:hypothetical protein
MEMYACGSSASEEHRTQRERMAADDGDGGSDGDDDNEPEDERKDGGHCSRSYRGSFAERLKRIEADEARIVKAVSTFVLYKAGLMCDDAQRQQRNHVSSTRILSDAAAGPVAEASDQLAHV